MYLSLLNFTALLLAQLGEVPLDRSSAHLYINSPYVLHSTEWGCAWKTVLCCSGNKCGTALAKTGFLMHRFSCRTEMQPWPALLRVAQGNLAGTLEE